MKFTFNGVSSATHNLIVKSSNHLSLPSKKIDIISVQGRTGDLIIDDESYNNQKITVVFYIDSRKENNLVVSSRRVAKWLQSPVGYSDLIFDDGLQFKAVCINQIDISKVIDTIGEVSVTFTAMEV